MDLLHSAYSNASDDEEEHNSKHQSLVPPSSKRPKPDNPYTLIKPESHPYRPPTKHYSGIPLNQSLELQREAPVPGRYISKRERALFRTVPDPNPNPPATTSSPVLGSISDSNLPHHILSTLRHRAEGRAQLGQISEKLTISLHGHTKAVNAVHWSTSHELVYSPSSCFCWDGSHHLHMECME